MCAGGAAWGKRERQIARDLTMGARRDRLTGRSDAQLRIYSRGWKWMSQYHNYPNLYLLKLVVCVSVSIVDAPIYKTFHVH